MEHAPKFVTCSPELFPGQFDPGTPVEDFPTGPCAEAYREFDTCKFDVSTAIPRCELSDLDPRLIEIGNKVYEKAPFVVNCAYRSREYDLSKGRSGASSHCKGLALDIKTIDHRQRLALVQALLDAGVRRIGIAKTFIHFDIDPDKMPSLWLYHPDNVNKMF